MQACPGRGSSEPTFASSEFPNLVVSSLFVGIFTRKRSFALLHALVHSFAYSLAFSLLRSFTYLHLRSLASLALIRALLLLSASNRC